MPVIVEMREGRGGAIGEASMRRMTATTVASALHSALAALLSLLTPGLW